MKSVTLPVVPRSIDRAKRIAKKLHEIYPSQPLAKCQEVTAHLLFHPDWHHLNAALKSGVSAGVFDHDLNGADLEKRLHAQINIAAKELGRVDSDIAIPAVDSVAREFGLVEKFHRLLAIEVIQEIRPTIEFVSSKTIVPEFNATCDSEWLSTLPQLLAKWWSTNIPDQPEVGNTLSDFKLDPNSKASLLMFGGYWGALSKHYAHTLDRSLVMGIPFLLGERYSHISLLLDPEYIDFLSKVTNPNEKISEGLLDELAESFVEQKLELLSIYLSSYPRDDLHDVCMAQPVAFKLNAQKSIKLLSKPEVKKDNRKI